MNKRVENVSDQAKKMREDAVKMGRNVWLAGLGAYALAEEEARGAFDRLVSRGEKFEKDEKNVVSRTIDSATGRVKEMGHKIEDTVQSTVTAVLHRAGIPSRDEIRLLIDRVEELNKKVEKIKSS